MPLSLTKRLVKGTPLTAAEFDANMTAVETALGGTQPLPVGVATAAGHATQLAQAQALGGSQYASVAALRAATVATPYCVLSGYYAAGDGGGGHFYVDASDTTTADDGGMCFVTGGGQRIKRITWGEINSRWFGVNPSQTDNTAALRRAIAWIKANPSSGNGGASLYSPTGYYRYTPTLNANSLYTVATVDFDGLTIRGDGRSTIFTVRSPSNTLDYFFYFSQTGVRGQGGGVRDIRFDGNSQSKWCVFLDSWRAAEFKNVWALDWFGGILDAANNQTTFGENILCHHLDYISSSGTNSCLSQYGVRFRAGSVGSWSECVIRDSLFVGCWDTGVYLDGCQRFTVNQIGTANDVSSTNALNVNDLSTGARAGTLHSVRITNSVTNGSTGDTGYHTVDGVYMESHQGGEANTVNVAVLIDTPAAQTVGFNRFNRVSNVALSTTTGPGLFRVECNSTSGLTSFNTFTGNRRAVNNPLIQVGVNVVDTYLWLTPNGGQLHKVSDQGTRTFINGVNHFAWGAAYPGNVVGSGKADVGYFSVDTATGRVVIYDRFNTPRLVGGQSTVYGAQQVSQLATPSAPSVIPAVTGSTSWTYYVVARDKDGNKTPAGSGTTIANGPASNTGSSAITVTWAPVEGAATYDLLRGDTSHSTVTGLTECYYVDANAGTSAYTAGAANPPGKLTVDGHFSPGASTAPTVAAGAAAGTSPTVSLISGSTDHHGCITVVTGTSTAGGTLATVTFAQAFGATPKGVQLTPANSAAAGLSQVYADRSALSTTSFVLKIATVPAASTTYEWYYDVGA